MIQLGSGPDFAQRLTMVIFLLIFLAAGEPPQCLSCSCLFAVQDAIYHAREEIKKDKEYFPLDGPATVEATQLKCLVNPSQFVF